MNIEVGGDPLTGDVHIVAVIGGQRRSVLTLRPHEIMPVLEQFLGTVAEHPDPKTQALFRQRIHPADWQILGASEGDVHVTYRVFGVDLAMGVPSSTVHQMARALDEPQSTAQ